MSKILRRASPAFLILGLGSCGAAASSADLMLLEIAKGYPSYGRVDNRNRWAPELCSSWPSRARLSESKDDLTHGKKLYFILAKDRAAYVRKPAEVQPEGQVVVKEAWEPKEVPGDAVESRELSDEAGTYVPFLERDGKHYTTGAKHALFIMVKQGSDWLYGTVTADGTKVIQSGKLTACVSCHQDAKPDSLFGLPRR